MFRQKACQIFQLLIFATLAEFSNLASVSFRLAFRQPAARIIEQPAKCNQEA